MTNTLASAIKAKAPIVAVPVEGHAPACIDGKRLRIWAKGVTVQTVRIEQEPAIWYPQEKPVPYAHEGPADLVAIKEIMPRFLVIEGQVASKGFRYSSAKVIKTRARFVTIARAAAIKVIGEWSDKERERLVSATITPAERKAFKALKFDGDQEGLIPVSLKTKGVRVDYRGAPVSIPQFPLLSFAVVRKDERSYSVTELLSGDACGFGTSAEKAILAAREKAATLTPERIGIITANCLAPAS